MRLQMRNRSNTEKWLFYNLLAIIIFLPLPLGSNRIWAWSLSETWIFAVTTCWAFALLRRTITIPRHVKQLWFPFACLTCFAVFTIIQITLPDNSHKPIDILNTMEWNLYSLDPHASMQHLLKTLSYLCLFALTSTLVNSEKRITAVLYAFFFSGLFQAGYGSVMTLTGIEKIFFMDKQAYIGKATGTFVNRNHFANYLVMCMAAGTALLLINLSQKRTRSMKETFVALLNFIMSQKMLLRIGLVIIVIGIVMSRSRMGNTSFFISLPVAGLAWMILTKRITRNAIILLTSLIVIDLLVVGHWFGFDKVQQRIKDTSATTETRDEVVRDTLVYIRENPITGTGGGSYYAVYPYYRQADVIDYYDFAHNDYLQFLSEYGIIGFLFIALFVVSSGFTALSTMRQRANPTLQAMGFAGSMVIGALLMHSLVDFNLQIMANAASAVIILCLVWISRYLPSNTPKRNNKQRQTTI